MKAALAANSCAACGGTIFDEESKILMEELKLVINQMPNDPDGLAGWLLSNYHLEKIDPEKEVEPAKFYYPKQGKKQKLKSQKLTKQQQFYNQNFDPEIDDEDEEQETDTSENPFFQQAGLNRSAQETQAILKKAKQKQGNDEWDPNVLKAIASMKPETMDYQEPETDFSTYENEEYIPTNQAPKSPQEVFKENMMRQNKSRAALSSHDPRGFRRSG
jgi:hypothetical protein